jgi:hypothetical protein
MCLENIMTILILLQILVLLIGFTFIQLFRLAFRDGWSFFPDSTKKRVDALEEIIITHIDSNKE